MLPYPAGQGAVITATAARADRGRRRGHPLDLAVWPGNLNGRRRSEGGPAL